MQLFVITDILEQEYMFKGGRCGANWLVLKANIFRTLLVMAAVLVAVCIRTRVHENVGPDRKTSQRDASSGLFQTWVH